MKFAHLLQKAMIDMNIKSGAALAKETGVSSYITRRLLKNDGTCCINDLIITANYLGVKIEAIGRTAFTGKGEE